MSYKNLLNQYSDDFLTAKTLPWSMRQFIISYGGVEKLRTEVWGRHWGDEFVRMKEQGKSERRARKLAQEHCQAMVLEMACTAGFLERRPRALKKQTAKESTDMVTTEQTTEDTISRKNQITLSESESQMAKSSEFHNNASIVTKPHQENLTVSTVALLQGQFGVTSFLICKSGEPRAIKFSSPVAVVKFFQRLHISDTKFSMTRGVSNMAITDMLGILSINPAVGHVVQFVDENAYMHGKKLDDSIIEIAGVALKRTIETTEKRKTSERKIWRDAFKERVNSLMTTERGNSRDEYKRKRVKRKQKNYIGRNGWKHGKEAKGDGNKESEPKVDEGKDKSGTESDKRKEKNEIASDERKDKNETERDENIDEEAKLGKGKDKTDSERGERNYENDPECNEAKVESDGKRSKSTEKSYTGREESNDDMSSGGMESRVKHGGAENMIRCIVEKDEGDEIRESCRGMDEYGGEKVNGKKKGFGRKVKSGISRFFHRLCLCGGQTSKRNV